MVQILLIPYDPHLPVPEYGEPEWHCSEYCGRKDHLSKTAHCANGNSVCGIMQCDLTWTNIFMALNFIA